MGYQKTFTPNEIQSLVTKAFVIEALTDKPDCTTRFVDTPGLPLTGFVHAGINSSQYFREVKADGPVYATMVEAIENPNKHKSPKYNNMGLLAVLFPAVIARLQTNKPDEVVDQIIEVIKNTNRADLEENMKAKKIAWSTSTKDRKKAFDVDEFDDCESVWDYYLKQNKKYHNDHTTSIWRWSQQHIDGLPILRAFFEAYMENDEYMETTKKVFEEQKAKYPYKMTGILADMCAAALFLYFSFSD